MNLSKKAQEATRGVSKTLLVIFFLMVIILILKVTGLVDFSLMTRSWQMIVKTFSGAKP